MILDFDKPKKALPTEAHNRMYTSDSGVDGTYVPNMSKKDMMKWKAKLVRGKDPRVEIRKTVTGYDPSRMKPSQNSFENQLNRTMSRCSAQVAITVRPESVIMSANGRMVWDNKTWDDFNTAIEEARIKLEQEYSYGH